MWEESSFLPYLCKASMCCVACKARARLRFEQLCTVGGTLVGKTCLCLVFVNSLFHELVHHIECVALQAKHNKRDLQTRRESGILLERTALCLKTQKQKKRTLKGRDATCSCFARHARAIRYGSRAGIAQW